MRSALTIAAMLLAARTAYAGVELAVRVAVGSLGPHREECTMQVVSSPGIEGTHGGVPPASERCTRPQEERRSTDPIAGLGLLSDVSAALAGGVAIGASFGFLYDTDLDVGTRTLFPVELFTELSAPNVRASPSLSIGYMGVGRLASGLAVAEGEPPSVAHEDLEMWTHGWVVGLGLRAHPAPPLRWGVAMNVRLFLGNATGFALTAGPAFPL